jgi:hypothetical protein
MRLYNHGFVNRSFFQDRTTISKRFCCELRQKALHTLYRGQSVTVLAVCKPAKEFGDGSVSSLHAVL